MLKISVLIFTSFIGVAALGANESAKDKVEEAANDTKKVVKKSVRNVKDKTCEMVNGKMECLGKKIKHKVENLKDEVVDKADD